MEKTKDVDTYIMQSAKEAHAVLKEIRELIKSTIPKANEGISWGVPFYKYHGALGGFALYKNHVSLGLAANLPEGEYRKTLEEKGYITGTKTVQIRFDQKVPVKELKQILKAQAKLNEARRTTK